MDRRNFFRMGLQKAAETAVRLADESVTQRARHWIRPPFAQAELEFLLACTRCDKCIEACPHDVIFKLPARLGAQVVGTPAMDVLNKGCHLCEDWPCVNACEPDALRLPAAARRRGRAVTEAGACGNQRLGLPALPGARMRRLQTCLPRPRRNDLGRWKSPRSTRISARAADCAGRHV